jgi:hypothetical protein
MGEGGWLQRGCMLGAAAVAMLVLLPASAEAVQFYATQDANGDFAVVDENGAQVAIATADPVGERPGVCPIGSYYVASLPTDSSKLVLTDCATGWETYEVELKPASLPPVL